MGRPPHDEAIFASHVDARFNLAGGVPHPVEMVEQIVPSALASVVPAGVWQSLVVQLNVAAVARIDIDGIETAARAGRYPDHQNRALVERIALAEQLSDGLGIGGSEGTPLD